MHKHDDLKPEEGMYYCEFLAEARRTLERKLEHANRLEATRLEVFERIRSIPTAPEPQPGEFRPEWPLTDSDVRRIIGRKWEHSDGSPLTTYEEVVRDQELAAALNELQYNRLLHGLVDDLRGDVRDARERLDEWRVGFNRVVHYQKKGEADTGGARNANRAARKKRGRRRK